MLKYIIFVAALVVPLQAGAQPDPCADHRDGCLVIPAWDKPPLPQIAVCTIGDQTFYAQGSDLVLWPHNSYLTGKSRLLCHEIHGLNAIDMTPIDGPRPKTCTVPVSKLPVTQECYDPVLKFYWTSFPVSSLPTPAFP